MLLSIKSRERIITTYFPDTTVIPFTFVCGYKDAHNCGLWLAARGELCKTSNETAAERYIRTSHKREGKAEESGTKQALYFQLSFASYINSKFAFL
jgi:hypothetical protein